MKKILLVNLFFLALFNLIINYSYAIEVSCPKKTTAQYRFINFVGRLDGLGGDKEVKVWFEYGTDRNQLNKKTKELVLKEPKIFCLRERKVKPCQTYYYRAVAQNSAGINYGEIKEIKTLCSKLNNYFNLLDYIKF